MIKVKYPKDVEEHFENILRYHEILGERAKKRQMTREWRKSLKERDGTAEGLARCIEKFDEYVSSF